MCLSLFEGKGISYICILSSFFFNIRLLTSTVVDMGPCVFVCAVIVVGGKRNILIIYLFEFFFKISGFLRALMWTWVHVCL